MSLITKIVSRDSSRKHGRNRRLSASSAFPRSVATTLKNTRSKQIFEALKQGLEVRKITVSSQQQKEGISTTANRYWHPKKRTQPLGSGEAGF